MHDAGLMHLSHTQCSWNFSDQLSPEIGKLQIKIVYFVIQMLLSGLLTDCNYIHLPFAVLGAVLSVMNED
jgi:hypothetical protein